jgi:hypothetical protein
MTLKVIGAGFGRTGTLSLKVALEKLGFNPCHHMMEVFGLLFLRVMKQPSIGPFVHSGKSCPRSTQQPSLF